MSPPVSWGEVPAGVQSFVLSLTDLDAAEGGWVHWFVINIPASVRDIRERASGIRDRMPPGMLEMRNSFGDLGYTGPKMERGDDPRTFEFAIRALSVPALSLGPFATSEEREKAIESVLLETATTRAIFAEK